MTKWAHFLDPEREEENPSPYLVGNSAIEREENLQGHKGQRNHRKQRLHEYLGICYDDSFVYRFGRYKNDINGVMDMERQSSHFASLYSLFPLLCNPSPSPLPFC